LDPLTASALAISDGERLSIIFSLDLIGINQTLSEKIRTQVAQQVKTVPEAVFLCCTHTHLGPCLNHNTPFDECEENEKYIPWLIQRLKDVAVMAANDLKKTEIFAAKGQVGGISFVRCFRMKDGSVETNPGWLNPNVEKPLFDVDEALSLVVFKREGGREIGIINFQIHPDIIGGCKFSADYPKFVRDTYEQSVDHSFCIYLNGADGDINHMDVTRGEDVLRHGYEYAKHVGRVIAQEALRLYPTAEPVCSGEIHFAQARVCVPYNTATEEELIQARRVYRLWLGGLDDEIYEKNDMIRITIIAKALRIMELNGKDGEKALYLSALSFGDVALSCLPGKPFCDVGRHIRNASGFKHTLISGCANGYEGYFPVKPAYEGGYESNAAFYEIGVAERLTEESVLLLNNLLQSHPSTPV
jgi:hypothetical protein